jgi:hypothetical protein
MAKDFLNRRFEDYFMNYNQDTHKMSQNVMNTQEGNVMPFSLKNKKWDFKIPRDEEELQSDFTTPKFNNEINDKISK